MIVIKGLKPDTKNILTQLRDRVTDDAIVGTGRKQHDITQEERTAAIIQLDRLIGEDAFASPEKAGLFVRSLVASLSPDAPFGSTNKVLDVALDAGPLRDHNHMKARSDAAADITSAALAAGIDPYPQQPESIFSKLSRRMRNTQSGRGA